MRTSGNCIASRRIFTQAVNLADKEPTKLRELQDLFWIEAAKYNCYRSTTGV